MTVILHEFCQKWGLWCLVGIALLYLSVTGLLASTRMLWNDELLSLYISQLTNASDFIAALSTGADQQPPPFYVLTHGVLAGFGTTHVTIRLPEIVGFLVMSLCLFRFVSKRLPVLYGLVAMVFPFVTGAYSYAYEARPYGLVLGFSSMSLLCWQEAAERSQRLWWLLGLALSSAATLASHYYAVFLMVPLGIGEVVRSLSRRHLDVPIWIALLSALLPLLAFIPLMQQIWTYAPHFWAKPEWTSIVWFYESLLTPTAVPLVAAFLAASLWSLREKGHESPPHLAVVTFPRHEVAAAIGFVAIPIVAIAVAKFVTGAFTDRYTLSAVIGVSILGTIALYRVPRQPALLGVCFIVAALVWFVVMGKNQANDYVWTTTKWSQAYDFLQKESDSSLPIVVADFHTFMTLAYYAPPDIAARTVYLADPHAAIQHLGQDTVDRGGLELRPWLPVNIAEYDAYMSTQEQFLLFARVQPQDLNWLLYKLRSAPVQIELKGRIHEYLLFTVSAVKDR